MSVVMETCCAYMVLMESFEFFQLNTNLQSSSEDLAMLMSWIFFSDTGSLGSDEDYEFFHTLKFFNGHLLRLSEYF